MSVLQFVRREVKQAGLLWAWNGPGLEWSDRDLLVVSSRAERRVWLL